MTANDEEKAHVLGRDVTDQAKSEACSGTAVVSVRLAVEELESVEAATRGTGKDLCHVVHEAVRCYLQATKLGQAGGDDLNEGGTATVAAGGMQVSPQAN